MTPRVRIVPPAAVQLAADGDAPAIIYVAADAPSRDALALATASIGLGIDLSRPEVRIITSQAQLRRLAGVLGDAGHAEIAGVFFHYLEPVRAWRLRTRSLPLDRYHIMGIVNLTEDSFSGDGVGTSVAGAVRRADALRNAGVSIIDVGAESARADRPALDSRAEAELIGSAVAALAAEGHCVSVDSYKPDVARAGLEAGAEIVNDISGLTPGDGAAREAIAARAGYVLNYSYSLPKRRPSSPPVYADVVAETVGWMSERTARLAGAGMAREQLAIDPGIAFGKSHDEDLQIIRRIGELGTFGLPVLLAHSRKNFIGSISGRPPAERELETHVVSALAYAQGVRIFRVHDVEGTRRALEFAAAVVSAMPGDFAPDGTSWPWRGGTAAAYMTRGEATKAAPPGQRW